MAYRPSYRRSTAEEEVEPNLTPVMNLMVVLIPLLLSSAQFIKIGIIDLNLPPAVGSAEAISESPKESEKKLDLAITITDQGFYISSSLKIIKGENEKSPSIPKIEDGQYDFEALGLKLYEIKQQANNKFPDDDNIVIQAEPEVNYQILVSTMDAARTIYMDERLYTLFPNVSLAAGIF